MKKLINLDANATTEINAKCKESHLELLKFSKLNIANIFSPYSEKIKISLAKSKMGFAKFMGVSEKKIIFTSGASESNATVCNAVRKLYQGSKGKNIVISSIEHKNMLISVDNYLSEFDIRKVGPNKSNYISFEDIKSKIDKNTIFVSVMAVNNETGLKNDFEEIAKYCKKNKILFHCDATQYFGKSIKGLKYCDSFGGSFHKLGGMKGVGFLYCDFLTPENALINGTQQDGLRGGTENFDTIISSLIGFFDVHLNRGKKNDSMANKQRKIIEKFKKIDKRIEILFIPNRTMPNIVLVLLGSVINSNYFAKFLAQQGYLIGIGSACNETEKMSYVIEQLNVNEISKMNIARISFDDTFSEKDLSNFLDAVENILSLPISEN